MITIIFYQSLNVLTSTNSCGVWTSNSFYFVNARLVHIWAYDLWNHLQWWTGRPWVPHPHQQSDWHSHSQNLQKAFFSIQTEDGKQWDILNSKFNFYRVKSHTSTDINCMAFHAVKLKQNVSFLSNKWNEIDWTISQGLHSPQKHTPARVYMVPTLTLETVVEVSISLHRLLGHDLKQVVWVGDYLCVHSHSHIMYNSESSVFLALISVHSWPSKIKARLYYGEI